MVSIGGEPYHPELYDAIVVTNLCVPTASGVPLRLLKKQINGVRIIEEVGCGTGVFMSASTRGSLECSRGAGKC